MADSLGGEPKNLLTMGKQTKKNGAEAERPLRRSGSDFNYATFEPTSCYGRDGITPGWNRSDRSEALAASFRYGEAPVARTWKISCMVRKSDE